jgi:hypothetical protein
VQTHRGKKVGTRVKVGNRHLEVLCEADSRLRGSGLLIYLGLGSFQISPDLVFTTVL